MSYNSLALFLLVLCLVSVAFAADKPMLMLGDFENPADLQKWEAGDSGNVELSLAPRIVTDTNMMLKFVAKGGAYPGFSMVKPPKDWSQYEVLSIVVWSSSAIPFAVRVDDEESKGYATRYNKEMNIAEGRSLIQIPLADVKKSIDLKRIRNVIFFLSSPPPGLTIYFDNILLGPPQTDTVDFIPYKDRYDLLPQMDVVTPHIPLARNLAGGPLKAFFITGVGEGREAVEMMQRMDYEVSSLTWDRNWDVNTWGHGNFYGMRGHIQDFNLMARYLASSMQGPETFEVMVMFTPIGWNRFGLGAREAILKRVKDGGVGLVMVMPYPGEEKKPWPDDLREVCALIDVESDFMPSHGYMKWNYGARTSKPWQVVKQHPILDGVPLEALPAGSVNIEKYNVAPDAEVILQTTDGFPVMAVRQVGKGRVVTFATRADSLTPNFDMNKAPRDYRFWEVWYDLINRSAYWAAGRSFDKTGQPVALGLEGPNKDNCLFAEQWKNAAGKVTAWKMSFAPAKEKISIPVTVTGTVNRGEPIDVAFSAPPVQNAAGLKYTALLQENCSGRLRTLLKKDFDANKMNFQFPTDKVSQYSVTITVETEMNGAKINGSAVCVVVPDAAWDDYEVAVWSGGGLAFLNNVEEQRMRDFGVTAASSSAFNEGEMRQLLMAGFRMNFLGFARGLHTKTLPEREWNASKDKKYLVRDPSLSDPQFLNSERSRIEPSAVLAAKYKPVQLIAADETSLTSYTKDYDFDWHPSNIASFRKYLADKFVSIDNMNTALGTDAASFDAVEPPTGEETKSSGKFGLFNEWRSFNDDVWAATFQFYRDIYKERYSQARLSVSGTQSSAVFNGIDWAKLMQSLDAVCDYGGRFQLLMRASFNPSYKSNPWGGYGRSGKAVDNQVWTNLLQNGAGMSLFWWYSLKNPDLTFSISGRDYQRVFAEIRSGIGRQIMVSKTHYDPIAVLWSTTSQRAAWLKNAFNEFLNSEAAVVNSLHEAGFRPYFVTDKAIADGELKKRAAKIVILPMSLSIGEGGKKGGLALLPALKQFMNDGGTVIATHKPEFDEFLMSSTAAVGLTEAAGATGEAILRKVSSAGIRPAVSAVLPNGTKLPNLSIYMHRLEAPAPAYIVTPVRAPIGFKDVLGADGVIHSVPDTSGGNEIETVVVDLTTFNPSNCFDIRKGRKLAVEDGKVKVEVPAGEGVPIAVLPYQVTALNASVSKDADRINVQWQLRGADKFGKHVMRVEVVDASTGKPDPVFSRNVDTASDGRGSISIPLALEDTSRKLTVQLKDVLTGTTWNKGGPGITEADKPVPETPSTTPAPKQAAGTTATPAQPVSAPPASKGPSANTIAVFAAAAIVFIALIILISRKPKTKHGR